MASSDAELDDLEFTALNQNWLTCKTFLNQIKERQNSEMSEKVRDLVASINYENTVICTFHYWGYTEGGEEGEREEQEEQQLVDR